MNQTLLRLLFDPEYEYENSFDHLRGQVILLITFALSIIWLIRTFTFSLPAFFNDQPLDPGTIIFTIIMPVLTISNYYLVRRGRVHIAAWVFSMFFVVTVGFVSSQSLVIGSTQAALALPLVISGILLSRRGLLTTVAILGFALISALFADLQTVQSLEIDPAESTPLILLSTVLILSIISLILYVLNSRLRVFANAAVRDIKQFQQIQQFSSTSETLQTEDEIINHFLIFVRNEMAFAFAQVYLLDDNRRPTRRIYTSAGQEQTRVSHEVDINEMTGLETTIQTAAPVQLSLADLDIRRKHFLPSTQYGLVLPLVYRDSVIGIVDLQQEQNRPFTIQQISSLSVLANQLGLAIAHTRTISSMQDDLEEQQSIIENHQQQLHSFQQISKDRIVKEWNSYFDQYPNTAIGYDLESDQRTPTLAHDLPETMQSAFESKDVIITGDGDAQTISIPIRYQNETLGAMSFTLSRGQHLSERNLDMMRSITERLALALDNKRLYEQSQMQAKRESQANEIGSQLLASTDIQAMLHLAADHFNQAMGAINTRIMLQPGILSESQPKEETV